MPQVDPQSLAPLSSPCESECATQQAALVECVKAMQQKFNAAGENNDSPAKVQSNPCLQSAVANWTECCAKANL